MLLAEEYCLGWSHAVSRVSIAWGGAMLLAEEYCLGWSHAVSRGVLLGVKPCC